MKYLKLLTILLLLPVLTYADFDTSLKYGAKGDKVVELQEFLIEKGFLNSEPTGNFYSLTLKAVKAFQTAYDLPSTGYFGLMSRTKANEILALENNAELEEVGSITPPVDTTVNKQLEDLNKKIEQQNAIIELQKQTQSQTNVILEQIKNNTNKMPEPTPPILQENKPDLSSFDFVKKLWTEEDSGIKVTYVSYRFLATDSKGEQIKEPRVDITAKLNGLEFENITLTKENDEYVPTTPYFQTKNIRNSFLKESGIYTFDFTYNGFKKSDEVDVK